MVNDIPGISRRIMPLDARLVETQRYGSLYYAQMGYYKVCTMNQNLNKRNGELGFILYQLEKRITELESVLPEEVK